MLRPHFGMETLSWMCILGAAPFALIGFVKYNGMTAEQFLWAWIKSEFLMPKRPVSYTHLKVVKPLLIVSVAAFDLAVVPRSSWSYKLVLDPGTLAKLINRMCAFVFF